MRFLNSVRSLYAAVGILILTFGLGAYVEIENEAMHARNLEINTSLERMVRLNQELTNMLVIAVLKQNALGTASYDTVKSDLLQTMETVTKATQMQSFAQDVASLSTTQAQLREFEGKTIDLINKDEWEKASGILFGDDYSLATKTYSVDSEAAVGAVTSELTATTQRFAHIKNVALGIRLAALVLLVWIGVMFTRRSRHDLNEQKRLRDELFEAYQGMEDRVNERTAALEQTTQRLAVENEERARADQRTRLILNSAGDGIFGVDVQEQGVFFNDAALHLLGCSGDDLLGQEIHRLIHHLRADGTRLPEEECPMHLACINAISKKVAGEVLWRRDGSSFLSEYSVTPILDDQGFNSGSVIVFRDITEERKNQQEFQERMDELQRFNHLSMGREERMIELKQEINAMLQAQGLPKKYRRTDENDPAPLTTDHSEGGVL